MPYSVAQFVVCYDAAIAPQGFAIAKEYQSRHRYDVVSLDNLAVCVCCGVYAQHRHDIAQGQCHAVESGVYCLTRSAPRGVEVYEYQPVVGGYDVVEVGCFHLHTYDCLVTEIPPPIGNILFGGANSVPLDDTMRDSSVSLLLDKYGKHCATLRNFAYICTTILNY